MFFIFKNYYEKIIIKESKQKIMLFVKKYGFIANKLLLK